jgi:hypothetical protein
MPTVLIKAGFRFHFFSADWSEPPHVHIDAKGTRAKVWLGDLSIAKRGDFSEPDMRRIMQIVEEHRERFLEAWNDFFA